MRVNTRNESSSFDVVIVELASPACTCSTVRAKPALPSGCTTRPTASVVLGTGTAIRAPALTPRVWSTRTRFPTRFSRNVTGQNAMHRSRNCCATSIMSPRGLGCSTRTPVLKGWPTAPSTSFLDHDPAVLLRFPALNGVADIVELHRPPVDADPLAAGERGAGCLGPLPGRRSYRYDARGVRTCRASSRHSHEPSSAVSAQPGRGVRLDEDV
ncbi:hypothetical protein LMG27177_07327 [Paraburkholderia fynbosensis]|uniref:Uncharacterized protein n=1 Tax=Paraburkholderia fynbosensis TaxID=1200993 RepID=A0A6J5H3Z6_9BURK|nr:hypothetical protein LMG27177_07327 [Paraburkholderia fynbosensis]